MGTIWRTYGAVLVTSMVALPGAALVVLALVRWRNRAVGAGSGTLRRSLADVGTVVGTAPWLVMTMQPNEHGVRRVNLLPLHDLLTVQVSALPFQIVGNLLVFAAAGFFLPMRVPAFASVVRVVTLAAVCAVGVEGMQYVLDIGRVSSVDDVGLNAAGAGIAAVLSRRWWATDLPKPT